MQLTNLILQYVCANILHLRISFSLRQVTVYLGQHDIARRRANRENRFKPREIVIHPKYVRNERDQVC